MYSHIRLPIRVQEAVSTETIDAVFQSISLAHFMSMRILSGRQITLVMTQGMYFLMYIE